MMLWQKLGLIYATTGELWWAKTHTHLPTAVVFDNFIRVYYTGLDEKQFGRIGYVDLNRNNPQDVLRVAQAPVLSLGRLGCFDDSGVVPSCVVAHDSALYLYYIGFQRTERVPYMLFTGLAISNDAGDFFTRYAQTPILDRTPDEPFSRSAPCILTEDSIFKMWYWSCVEWTDSPQGMHYNNVIRYATSQDGIQWRTYEDICIAPNCPDEYSIGRPSVIHDGNLYRMWYSVRSASKPYIIGYAESEDGIHWTRKDNEAGITLSRAGWDSEMICYPHVVDIDGRWHMFYNGNRHGLTGFGFAVLEGW